MIIKRKTKRALENLINEEADRIDMINKQKKNEKYKFIRRGY